MTELKNILWVDDRPKQIEEISQEICSFLGNYKIHLVGDFVTAKEKLAKWKFSLLIVDVYGIPEDGLDDSNEARDILKYHDKRVGLAFSQVIREGILSNKINPDLHSIPIFLVSALSEKTILKIPVGANNFYENTSFFSKSSLIQDLGKFIDSIEKSCSENGANPGKGVLEPGPSPTIQGVQEFARNIAWTLHEQEQELLAVREAVNNIEKYFEPNPFSTINSISFDLTEVFKLPMKELDEKVRQLKNYMTKNGGIFEEAKLWNDVKDCISASVQLNGRYHGMVSGNVWQWVDKAKVLHCDKDSFYLEKVESALKAARNLERYLCCYDLTMLKTRLSGIINSSGQLSAYYGESKTETSPVSMKEVVERAVEITKSNAILSGVELGIEPTIKVDFTVKGVSIDLIRTIKNIIFNGIKYSYSTENSEKYNAPWVKVTLKGHIPGFCAVIVESWGAPISEKEINDRLIFMERYRGDVAKSISPHGNGMGLADAERVVENHNGRIIVETTVVQEKPIQVNINIFKVTIPYTSSNII